MNICVAVGRCSGGRLATTLVNHYWWNSNHNFTLVGFDMIITLHPPTPQEHHLLPKRMIFGVWNCVGKCEWILFYRKFFFTKNILLPVIFRPNNFDRFFFSPKFFWPKILVSKIFLTNNFFTNFCFDWNFKKRILNNFFHQHFFDQIFFLTKFFLVAKQL